MRLFLSLFFLCISTAYAGSLTERAVSEAWTFEFDASEPKYQTGLDPQPLTKGFQSLVDFKTDIPETYDLRDKITPIKNQGNCGSCWAFALTAQLEDALKLFGKYPGALSQQYLNSCSKASNGCNGGYFESARDLMAPKGAPLFSAWPYLPRNEKCQTLPVAGSGVEWGYVGARGRAPSEEEIKKVIVKYGPPAVDVYADNAFMSYRGGDYNACRSGGSNHMINIVGWKPGFWLVRNSWGTSWGENGFGWIKMRGSNGRLCNNLASVATYMDVSRVPAPDPKPREVVVESKSTKVKVLLKKENTVSTEEVERVFRTTLERIEGVK